MRKRKVVNRKKYFLAGVGVGLVIVALFALIKRYVAF